ncbi:hypothetical protein JTB14_026210 [Gonioctena quinquepunctata]|nr:hypothetical protein JTB14_026210 [Gonioctena quinquepunctata]
MCFANTETIYGKNYTAAHTLLLELWILKEKSNEKSSGIEEPYSEKDVLLQEIKELVEEQKKEKLSRQKNKLAENKKNELGKTVRNEAAIRFLERNECILLDHDYNGIIIEDSIVEVPSESPVISDNISVVTEKENETPKMNIPTKEIHQNHSKSTAGIAIKKKATNSKNILGPIRTRAKRTTYMRRSGLEYLQKKQEKELEIEEERLNLEERKVAVSERTTALAEKKFSLESENYNRIFDSQQEIIHNLLDIVKDLKSN